MVVLRHTICNAFRLRMTEKKMEMTERVCERDRKR